MPTLFGSIAIVFALLLTLVAAVRVFSEKDRSSFVLQPTLTALFGALLLLSATSAISADRLNDMSFIVSFFWVGFASPALSIPSQFAQAANIFPNSCLLSARVYAWLTVCARATIWVGNRTHGRGFRWI